MHHEHVKVSAETKCFDIDYFLIVLRTTKIGIKDICKLKKRKGKMVRHKTQYALRFHICE